MAARERLQVILELVASQYKREAKQAASATGQVADAASRAGTSTGGLTAKWSTFSKVAATGGVLALGRQVGMFAKEIGELSVQVEGWGRRANTVFGDNIELARRWADANNEAFGMGEQALLGMLAATGDLLVPLGFARDEALDLSQKMLLAANAGNEWSAGAVSVESAAERIRKAMLGEREGLIELGIKITEADVKQRLLATGKANLTGEAEKQARAEETLNLIYEQSADSLAAAASGTSDLIGARKELAAVKADFKESLADATLEPQIATFGAFAAALKRAGNLGTLLFGKGTEANLVEFQDMLQQVTTRSGQALTGISAFSAGVVDAGDDARGNADALVQFALSLGLTEDELMRLALVLEDSSEAFNIQEEAGKDAAAQLEQIALNSRWAGDMAAYKAARTGEAAEAEEEHADQVGRSRLELWKVQEAAFERAEAAQSTTEALWAQIDAETSLQEVLAAAASPLEQFIDRFERYQQKLDDFSADGVIDEQEELALMFDLMQLKASALSPDEYNEAITAMSIATGKTRDEIMELLDAMGLVDGKSVDVFIRSNYSTTGPRDLPRGVTRLASGGPATAGNLYQVGENNRPELFMIPGDSGRVFSNADTRALINGLSRPAGGGSHLTVNMQSVEPNVDAQRVAAMAAVQRRMETN